MEAGKYFEMEKTFNIDKDKLFQDFKKKEKLMSWVQIDDNSQTEVENDFVEGGEYSIKTSLVDGSDFSWHGIYRKIDENNSIECTWSDQDITDSLVKIEFDSYGPGKTLLKIRHSNFPDTKTMMEHKAVWMGIINHLEEFLDKPEHPSESTELFNEGGAYY